MVNKKSVKNSRVNVNVHRIESIEKQKGDSRRCGVKYVSRTAASILALMSGLVGTAVVAQDADVAVNENFVDEILVTAQRRSERIEDVPISVAALNQDMLVNLNITTTDKLQYATPGIVNTSTSGDGISTLFIRGVGTGYSGPGLEGSVAVYLDDAYLQTQTSSGQSSIDVSQIEVLKGPQGTLYGRNATGGAVLIRTNDPVLGSTEGYLQVGYGSLNWQREEAVINMPVTEDVAIRFAGFFETRDGYVSNTAVPEFEKSGVGAGKTASGRIKLLWAPNDDLKFVGKVGYDRRNGNGAVHSLRFSPDGASTGLGFYETTQSPNREGGGGDDTESFVTSLQFEKNIGDWTLSNTAAYREARAFGCTDNDGVVEEIIFFCSVSQNSPNPGTANGKEDKTFTNEVRLVSGGAGPLNVTLGGFYEHNSARFLGRVGGTQFGGALIDFDNRDGLNAYSAYVDGTYDFTDVLSLSGGLRYTYEEKSHSVVLFQDPSTLVEDETSFSNVSPRIVLSYHPGLVNYYASYSRGFKSGGYNSPSFGIDPILDPEKIGAFEVGAKYRSSDGNLSVTTAAFSYDWDGVQVAFITGGGTGIQQQNAAGAEIYGAEMDVDYNPTSNLRLNAGFAYTHGRFASFPNAAVYNLNSSGLLSATAENLEGFRLPHAPDVTGNASATYTYDLQNGWSGDVTAMVHYSSKYDFTAGGGGELRAAQQDALAIINLTGRIQTPYDPLEFGWFISNLTDEKQVQLISTGDTGVYMTPGEPRVYGVTARVNF